MSNGELGLRRVPFKRLHMRTCTRRLSAWVIAPVLFVLSATAALAETWALLIPPAPYSSTPPPYASWSVYQTFDSIDACAAALMSLHYQFWKTDQDLSMRTLAGVCRNESTGEIVTSGEDEGGW